VSAFYPLPKLQEKESHKERSVILQAGKIKPFPPSAPCPQLLLSGSQTEKTVPYKAIERQHNAIYYRI
jgi:hypothetical protein